MGSSQGTLAASYVHNWKLGKKQRFEMGLGARFTTYFGTKKEFITAGPAKYTRSSTIPFLIVFAGQLEENFDTLTVQRPLTHSINISANLGYQFSSRWYGGINIDLIGFTFGRKDGAVFTGIEENGDAGNYTEPAARPATFNVLLTGDHDQGTLNSEFFIKYRIDGRWHIKAVYQFLFVEYVTTTLKQQIPGGPLNDRFRNKANNLGLGVSFSFKQ